MIKEKDAKRQKKISTTEIANQLWEYYRNYLDSLQGDFADPAGDIDELQELVLIAKDHVRKNENATMDDKWNSIEDMLPMLVSVAHCHLAENAIAEYLQPDQDNAMRAKDIQALLTTSLEFYPFNAATWSMGANFGRMTHLLTLSTARRWYEQAAMCAARMRAVGLRILGDDEVEDAMLKEWIELLVLNQVTGVEFEVADDGEDDEDSPSDHPNTDEEDDTSVDGEYSASAVEATSRFMCAMLCSMEGRHDAVVENLKPFGVTHRLHPNIWKKHSNPSTIPERAPLMFSPDSGILPTNLYDQLKCLFAPDAAYWRESSYMSRDYFSFFMDYDRDRNHPRNLIEHIIVNYLLPRVKQVLSNDDANSICGFEWWTHTRPIKANLGHNLHFDTDESMLAQEGRVTHPIISSVLYLSGGNTESSNEGCPAGATIILDQSPHAEEVGKRCWQGIPRDNSFLLFPGNLLHGVLPCPGKEGYGSDENALKESDTQQLWNDWKNPTQDKDEEMSRLTFMVGFWTRNVPATMKDRKLYGPCGKIPPSTKDHSWVQEIEKNYKNEDVIATKPEATMKPSALPCVTPAWERIPPLANYGEDDQELTLPSSIDHRFFVKNAPSCFYNSLFEETQYETGYQKKQEEKR